MRVRVDLISLTAGIATTVIAACVGAWIGTWGLFRDIVLDTSLSGTERFAFAKTLLVGGFTDQPPIDSMYLWTIAVLFGVNVGLTVAFVRAYRRLQASFGLSSGIMGLVSALLGFGCAACGTLGAGWALASIGAGGLVAALPFGGAELRILGIALLALSTVFLAREIRLARTLS